MKIFVTGGSGFVGSAVVERALASGHQVLALARSDESAEKLERVGATPHRGSLQHLKSLGEGASQCDGAIHLGFQHDFSQFAKMCELDHRAVLTLGRVFHGSRRPLVVTSGTALVAPGRLVTEEDELRATVAELPRAATDVACRQLEQEGLHVTMVRLPIVHGEGDHGFLTILADIARQRGFSAYIEDGKNLWSSAHRLDTAAVYLGALEHGAKGERFHAVAEQGVVFKDIATVIARRLNLPVRSISRAEAREHFGWFANFAAIDCPASSEITRRRLNWTPTQTTMLEDLASDAYFA